MADRYWVGGSGTWDATSTTHWSATTGGAAGASAPTAADNVFINASSGSPTITLSGTIACLAYNNSAPTCTINGGATWTVAGSSFAMSGGAACTMALTSGTVTFTATCSITTSNSTVQKFYNLTINAPALTVTTSAPVVVTNLTTLTAGTLSMSNANALTTGYFNTSGAATRVISSSSAPITITGNNGTIWDATTSTGLTLTFSAGVGLTLTYTGAVGTRTIVGPAPGITVNGNATDTISITAGSSIKFANFTNFNGTLANTAFTFLPTTTESTIFSAAMTVASGANTVTVGGTGLMSWTTNGKTLNFPLVVSSTGGLNLLDALTMGAGFGISITAASGNGFFQNKQTITANTFTVPSGTATISLDATLILDGTGTVFQGNSSGLSATAATISLTNNTATARTFDAGTSAKTFYAVIIGGNTSTSTTTFIGTNNTYYNFLSTKTVAHTITFTAATSTTFRKFAVTGTAGNVVTINTTGAAATWTAWGTQANLNYLSISNINGSLATNWYVGANSTNVTGNTNLTFSTLTGLYWVGGTGTWNTATTNWSATNGGAGGAGTPGAGCDANFTSLSGASPTITFSSAAWGCQSLIIPSTNGTLTFGTLGSGTVQVYGNIAITGGTVVWSHPTGLSANGFGNSVTNSTITTSAVSGSFVGPFTVNAISTTVTLNNAVTFTGAFTYTSGNLNLQTFTLTALTYVASTSNAKTLTSTSTGNITVTGTGLVVNVTGTGLTMSGQNAVINVANNSVTAATINTQGGGFTSLNPYSINLTTGTYALTESGGIYKNLNLTGFAGTLPNVTRTIYGNFTCPNTGGTYTAGTNITSFVAPSGTQILTTNGRLLSFPMAKNAVGGTLQLGSASGLDLTYTFDLTSGTLDLNNFTLTCGIFSSSNTNVRNIAFGTTGNITVVNTTFFSTAITVSGTNLTRTGTPTFNLNNNSANQVNVSWTTGFTEANALSLNVTVGTYTISDSNTYYSLNHTGFTGTAANTARTIYKDFTAGTGTTYTAGANAMTFAASSGTSTLTSNAKTLDFPLTFGAVSGTATYAINGALTMGSTRALTLTNGGTLQYTASTTNTVGSFVTTDTTLKYLKSSVTGTQATMTKAAGATTVTYLSIRDSNVTGGTWTATDVSNQNLGNNTGWTIVPIFSANTNFLLMF